MTNREAWVIATLMDGEVVPISVIKGTRQDAELVAGMNDRCYVLGEASLYDWT